MAFSSSNLIAIKAMGRSDVYMKLELVRRVVMLGILMISVFCFRSITAIAVGYVISSWLDWLIVTIPIKRLLDYGLLQQLKDTRKIFLASILMGGIVFAMSLLPGPSVFNLLLQIGIGIAVYFGACKLLRVESFQYALDCIKKMLQKNKE